MDYSDPEAQRARMNILFLSRKRAADRGGLSRFVTELTCRFPKITWQKRIDVIHATDATLLPLGTLLKILFRVPLIVTAHGKDIVWPHMVYQHILTFCRQFVNAWVVDSPAAARLLKTKAVHAVHIIAPGISINHFKRHADSQLTQLTGKTVMLTIGNLVPRKGHVWFIRRVLTKLPKRFIYLIVGTGKEQAHIEREIQRAHVQNRVYLLGSLSDSQIASLFHITHIYVAPNRNVNGDFEGFGIAAGEAAAMGLPVLASSVDGLPAVIHHNKNGLLMASDPNAWANTIRSMESHGMRARMGKKARRYTLSHFTWKKTTLAYVRLFQEVAGKTKGSRKRLSPKRTGALFVDLLD